MQIIIYLDTGAGKTLVAALLAKHQIAKQYNQDRNKTVVCLVPTTILVSQQAAVFRKYVAQSIGEYTGDTGVDAWNTNKWYQEIESKAMLVMTPAILSALISDGTVPFSSISLLIFDEAHHCTKKHPYANIMRKYHDLPEGSERPKIFGMTASPVNTKAGSTENMRKSIQQLQELMDARLKTVSDVAKFVPIPEKERLQYQVLDFEGGQNPMIVFALQIVLQDQRLLSVVTKYQNLQHRLVKLQNLPKGAEIHELDSRGALTRAEGVKDWLLNKFGFCLVHQGPFCAALLLQEYFEHAAPDGMLSTLGELGVESEFYSHTQRRKTPQKRNGSSHNTVVREEKLRHVQDEIALLENSCEKESGSAHALRNPMVVLKQALLHAVVLCIRMLVPHPALSILLATQAHAHLMGETSNHDTNGNPFPAPDALPDGAKASSIKMRGLSLLLEATLQSVPQALLEQSIAQSCQRGPVASGLAAYAGHRETTTRMPQMWHECMGCALVTDKVVQCLYKLLAHREKVDREQQQQAAQQEKSTRVRWAALVFAQRQSCCLTLHLLCQRISSCNKVLQTGALMSRNQGGVGTRVCKQGAILQRFREGAVNALFSTSVAEEGLDVQDCSIVICYDVPKRPLSMVQTMGRARARFSEHSIKKMEEYNHAMRTAVALWDAAEDAALEPLRSSAFHIPGGVRPILGSEARTILAQFAAAVASWHRELHTCTVEKRKRAEIARSLDQGGNLHLCPVRFSTGKTVGCYQVAAHIPPKAREFMTPHQREILEDPVLGEPHEVQLAAKDNAAAQCVTMMVFAGVLDEEYRPIVPADIAVRLPLTICC